MNSFITFVLAVCALVASVQASSYGSSLGVQSYSLGAHHGGYGHGSLSYGGISHGSGSYGGSSHGSGSYGASSYGSRSAVAVQPLWGQEIYAGRNDYKSYHSAPTYSQITLPVVHSAPLAKLYDNSHSSGSYGSSY